eukprot:COSAG02_NODE_6384_length_3608_cov_2.452266_3_plen_752_part_01
MQKATIIYPSWATNKKSPCTTPKLPPLKLPGTPGEAEYNVRIKFAGQGKTRRSPIDDYIFKVTVVPGQAVQWKMELRDKKIRCGVEKDMHNAVEVYAADRCGNRARQDSEEDSTIKPILAVKGAVLTASVPESKKARELSLRPIRDRRLSGGSDVNGYTLAPKYQMGLKARLDGTVGQCKLTVSDADGRLQACNDAVDLIPGEPARIVLESNIIDDAETGEEHVETTQYSAHVPAKFKLEDLVAKLVDTSGNVVSIGAPLTLRATADSAVKTRAVKTRAKNGLAKFPSIDLSAGKSAKSFTLQIEGSSPPSLLSALLVCRVVLSNAVVGMKHTLSVESAVCGQPLKAALEIELLTEDGNKFVPSDESLECEIKRKQESQARPSQQHKTAVPVFDFFDGGASVKDGVWVLDDVGGDAKPFVPEQTGVYQIVCMYQESRAGMQGSKPLKLPDTPQFPILAAPAVKLVCSNNRSTVNANNGKAPAGRKLLKFQIKPVDKYGNIATFPDDCNVRAMLTGTDGTDHTKWPALEDSEDSGVYKGCVLHPATNKDTGKHQRVGMASFDLRLKEGVGEAEGVYDLKFTVISNAKDKNAAADDVESLTIHVNFTPDGIRSKEIEEKQARLEDLLAEETALKNNFDQAAETYRELKADMKAKVKTVKDLLGELAKAGNVWAQEDLNACNNTRDQEGAAASVKYVLSSDICEQITTHAGGSSAALDQETPRAATVRPRTRMDAIRKLGQPLVELGFVDDADLA